MKENILACKNKFKDKEFEVIFHHSLDRRKFKDVYQSSSNHVNKHNNFVEWLEKNNVKFIDISGSAENLINYYNNIDLHIGYRVHAHIFMNSITKKSILISEDGRAKGVKGAIGGIVLDGYLDFQQSYFSRVLNRLLPFYDKFKSNSYLTKELLNELDYEDKISFYRFKEARRNIDQNYLVMKNFLNQLP